MEIGARNCPPILRNQGWRKTLIMDAEVLLEVEKQCRCYSRSSPNPIKQSMSQLIALASCNEQLMTAQFVHRPSMIRHLDMRMLAGVPMRGQ
jgi:hypothetical protein